MITHLTFLYLVRILLVGHAYQSAAYLIIRTFSFTSCGTFNLSTTPSHWSCQYISITLLGQPWTNYWQLFPILTFGLHLAASAQLMKFWLGLANMSLHPCHCARCDPHRPLNDLVLLCGNVKPSMACTGNPTLVTPDRFPHQCRYSEIHKHLLRWVSCFIGKMRTS